MGQITVGLQLYTLREETQQDFIGTLKKVAAMGYQAVEFAGYGDIPAKEMRSVLDGLGLKALSSHVPMDALENQLDQQIAYSQEIGAEVIVCPWLPMDILQEESSFQSLLSSFRRIGQTCKDNGMIFAYHNHAFEFEKTQGAYILDRMYQEVDASLMQAELDLYWVTKAGLSAKDYLLQYSGRVPFIHVKDMADDENRSFAEVGQGVIDYPSIFEAAEKAGVRAYIVEQDNCYKHLPLESIQISMNYMKSLGLV